MNLHVPPRCRGRQCGFNFKFPTRRYFFRISKYKWRPLASCSFALGHGPGVEEIQTRRVLLDQAKNAALSTQDQGVRVRVGDERAGRALLWQSG